MRRLVVVALLVACKPHVNLVPPPPNATPDQRVQAFEQLHATSEKTTWTTSCRGGGGCSTTVEKTLYLANGTRVYHEEDLLPVLPPNSESAREVRAAQRARSRQLAWGLGGAGVFVASFIVFAKTDPESPGLVLGVGFGAALVGAFMAYKYHYEAADHVGRANETYNAGLAETLRVCTQGYAIVACESSTPGAPTPPGSTYYPPPPATTSSPPTTYAPPPPP